MRANPCIRLSQPNLIDHLKKLPSHTGGKKTRLSQPNLHITPVRGPPQSQSSIESQDSMATFEGTRSTTPCPPSYSPASQRSRYSQPNLPTLQVPYVNANHSSSSSGRKTIGGHSYDRRIRMSQPTLNSSFSGIFFAGISKGRLSYSSLRATSGDNSINEQERLSIPNVLTLLPNEQRSSKSRLSQPDVSRIIRPDLSGKSVGKRDRLSQPTLVTGDYYPSRMLHQRLSQPCLPTGGRDLGLTIAAAGIPYSPIKQKRFGISTLRAPQRDRLDYGNAKYKLTRESIASNVKFNRDRFSIPELESQNELRHIAGTPKQRFSLDSQLNPEKGRLLPIASSPISEIQAKLEHLEHALSKCKTPVDGMESVFLTTTTPILQPTEQQLLMPSGAKSLKVPKFPVISGTKSPGASKTTIVASSISTATTMTTTTTTTSSTLASFLSSSAPIVPRERMSVPELRNSSLRRLLDPPVKQRHSLTGNIKQCILSATKVHELAIIGASAFKGIKEPEKEPNNNSILKEEVAPEAPKQEQPQERPAPKHIQRHYSYTYDTKEESLPKLNVPRKKYLESNFDENEQVITTVIESEVPVIMSHPRYLSSNSKTRVYASEAPKWMRKYFIENETNKLGVEATNQNRKRKIDCTAGGSSAAATTTTTTTGGQSFSSSSSVNKENQPTAKVTNFSTAPTQQKEKDVAKNSYVRIMQPSFTDPKDTGNKYEVLVDTNWTKENTEVDRRCSLECDNSSDDSTSI